MSAGEFEAGRLVAIDVDVHIESQEAGNAANEAARPYGNGELRASRARGGRAWG